jgi:putative transposase
VWENLFRQRVEKGRSTQTQMIDFTHIRRAKPAKKRLGDKVYDSAELRQWLADRGMKAVIPSLSNRKNPFSYDKRSYKQRHRVENAICRLKDFRRIATRYDRLARNFGSGLCCPMAVSARL